jgi:ribonuclease Z
VTLQAQAKRHSTTSEALAVAADMRAYRTILTHFSQRYAKLLPDFPTHGPAAERTAMAFDGMRVPLKLLPWLPEIMPGVTLALQDEEDIDQQDVP